MSSFMSITLRVVIYDSLLRKFIRKEGVGYFIRGIGKLLAAPFIGLAYVIFLPIGFIAMFCYAVFKGIVGAAGKSVSFGWRPAEAYLGGSKKAKQKKKRRNGVPEERSAGSVRARYGRVAHLA